MKHEPLMNAMVSESVNGAYRVVKVIFREEVFYYVRKRSI